MPRMQHSTFRRPRALKPAPLAPGDTIGIVAPASNVQREELEAGKRTLERIGYKTFYFESIFDRELFFAGSVERRVHELHQMFARPDIRAIVCARGGYGSGYLLDQLDLDLIKRNPKIIIGYSDLTSLLTYLCDNTGLVVFHGPMAAKDFAAAPPTAVSDWPLGVHAGAWECALAGAMSEWAVSELGGVGGVAVAGGLAEGVLYGGCLSI